VRTKMERDILVDVRHPFIVHLEYGETFFCVCEEKNFKKEENFPVLCCVCGMLLRGV